jgi:hypothetical protein
MHQREQLRPSQVSDQRMHKECDWIDSERENVRKTAPYVKSWAGMFNGGNLRA